ncbi:MAG: DinB family protein [Anaerolineales bacterium]|nr:DinB family protein [Anaerolineales bacterium]
MNLKEDLTQEMEVTRQDFHHLLDSVPESFYSHPSHNPAWTVGEVLFHITLAPRFLTADLRMIIGQAWISKVIGLVMPKSVFDKLNEIFTRRWAARNMNREKLKRSYDKAHENAMRALKSLNEADFQKSLEYPAYDELLGTVVTVEGLFRYIKIHFDTHAGQINMVLRDNS